MLIIFLALCISILISMRVNIKNINSDYIGVDNTLAVKGIFIIIVFMSHIRSYEVYDGPYDSYILRGIDYLGQLMVAMFLFYSGYGIYESVKRKGKTYIDLMPKNRILKTFKDFAIAILLFLGVDLILGIKYPVEEILLAFTGWTSIGNSNWYMFAIFTLYIITYISFKLFFKNHKVSILVITLLSFVYIYLMQRYKGGWWCDTYLCYVAGMAYSYFREKLDNLMTSIGNTGYMCALLVTGLIYLFVSRYRFYSVEVYNIVAICFCLVIVVATMKVSLKSKLLMWCGKNLFWLYILQRIPMLVLKHFNVNRYGQYVFTVLCGLITVVMTVILQYLLRKCYEYYAGKKIPL